MTEDLQVLLEKINRDGVEKAQAQAEAIIAEAKVKADGIVARAREEAKSAKAESEQAAKAFAEHAEATVRQSARDIIISIGNSLTGILEKLLRDEVDKSLAKPETLGALVGDAVKSVTGAAEVSVPEKLVPAIRAKLAGEGRFTVTASESAGSGFTVRTDGGRVEHTFTGEAIAAELARRLRPDLAKLVKDAD